jgi:hypothetical protein
MRVVCSLTTIPSRIDCNNLVKVLESIKNQDRPFDAIYLTVPKFFKRGNKPYPHLPDCILSYCTPVYIDTDYGPISKIVGGLMMEQDPNTIIIVVDDDSRYPKTLVSNLLDKHNKFPNCAISTGGFIYGKFPGLISVRARNINNFGSQLVKYWFEIPENTPADLLLGVYGVLYKRGFFPSYDEVNKELLELALSDPIVFRNDDVLLSCYLNSKDIPRIVVDGDPLELSFNSRDALSANIKTSTDIIKAFNTCKKWGLFKKQEHISFFRSFLGPIIILLLIIIIIIIIIIIFIILKC